MSCMVRFRLILIYVPKKSYLLFSMLLIPKQKLHVDLYYSFNRLDLKGILTCNHYAASVNP